MCRDSLKCTEIARKSGFSFLSAIRRVPIARASCSLSTLSFLWISSVVPTPTGLLFLQVSCLVDQLMFCFSLGRRGVTVGVCFFYERQGTQLKDN